MRISRFVSIFICILVLFKLTTIFAFADESVRGSLDQVAPAAGLVNICQGSSCVPTIIGGVVKIALGFLGVGLIGYILYGGYLWMTAGGEKDQIEEAQKVIRNAIIGVFIVGFSYTLSRGLLRFITEGFNPPSPPPAEALPATPGQTPSTEQQPTRVDPFAAGCVRSACSQICISQDCSTLTGQRRFTCESTCQNQCQSRCALDGSGVRTQGTPAPACNTNACEESCMRNRCPDAITGVQRTGQYNDTAGRVFGVGGQQVTGYDTSPAALQCRATCHTTCTAQLCPTGAVVPEASNCQPLGDYRQCIANCQTDATQASSRQQQTRQEREEQAENLQICTNTCSYLYCRTTPLPQ